MSDTTVAAATDDNLFRWEPQPGPARWISSLVENWVADSSEIRRFAERLLLETGTRLIDWIDHLAMPEAQVDSGQLEEMGFCRRKVGSHHVWLHDSALLPPLLVDRTGKRTIVTKVESTSNFLFANSLSIDDTIIVGKPLAPIRLARVSSDSGIELWVAERHGYGGFDEQPTDSQNLAAVLFHQERLLTRRRDFDNAEEGFQFTEQLIQQAIDELGVDRTCDLFFSAERAYWQRRNQAARIQKARQDRLGLGWANHDHHTYRSSREHFGRLVHVLELLGFTCRERFYAGQEAGWGAQVLEQTNCGLTVFADVDLAPEEVAIDFAHLPLQPRQTLGTVGLWCRLHGEAFLQAGMHHLECQFDFEAARVQLENLDVPTMAPFTDLPYLKQRFTEAEIWPVAEERIEAALRDGYITPQQAEDFRRDGARGSHLEVLQRDEGYKGFNQTGISEIISRTDPRNR